MRSPWGRVLKSIREDENAARALGKNVLAFKMQSLILGGLIGSIGGLLLAAQLQSAQPGRYATTLTFFAFTIVVLGGMGRVKGPIVGTVIFFFVIQFVDNFLSEATRTRSAARLVRHTEQLRAGEEHRVRVRAGGTGRVPAAGHLRRPQGTGLRCPLRAQSPCRWPTVRACPRPTRSSSRTAFGGPSVDSWPSTWTTPRSNAVEITALIGPNGAGKTTFFNLLTGFDEPNQGHWTFDGTSIEGLQPYKVARLGMVRTFQLTKVLARLTVIENMRLGATGQVGERLYAAAWKLAWRSQEREITERADDPAGAVQARITCATSSPATCRAASASCSRWRER